MDGKSSKGEDVIIDMKVHPDLKRHCRVFKKEVQKGAELVSKQINRPVRVDLYVRPLE